MVWPKMTWRSPLRSSLAILRTTSARGMVERGPTQSNVLLGLSVLLSVAILVRFRRRGRCPFSARVLWFNVLIIHDVSSLRVKCPAGPWTLSGRWRKIGERELDTQEAPLDSRGSTRGGGGRGEGGIAPARPFSQGRLEANDPGDPPGGPRSPGRWAHLEARSSRGRLGQGGQPGPGHSGLSVRGETGGGILGRRREPRLCFGLPRPQPAHAPPPAPPP